MKKSPWIPPPGRSRKTDCNPSKKDNADQNTTQVPPKTTTKDQEKVNQSNSDDDLESVISNSSNLNQQEEMKAYLHDIKQEQRVLNLYFMSLRPISQFLTRNVNEKNSTLRNLTQKAEDQLNYLLTCFEDLEFVVCSFENDLHENRKLEEFKKILKLKENLLLKLLGSYTDILTAFQIILEERDSKSEEKCEKQLNSLKQQLLAYEKRNFTQSSMIKDLEKQLSLLKSKYSTLESYNKTLEETRIELQKILHNKDYHLKTLNSELNQVNEKQVDENLIKLIEEIKERAQAEKTALKKAIKSYKLQIEQKNQLIKKGENDIQEKVDMLFDLAAQRDKLKVQLTVANNEIIETKHRIEEFKCKILKLENELHECDFKFKNKLEEETDVLKKVLKEKEEEKTMLKNKIKSLEDELSLSAKSIENLKSSHHNEKLQELQTQRKDQEENSSEIKNLISMLQDIKNTKQFRIGAQGDGSNIEANENIIMMIQDLKKDMEEMKFKIQGSNRDTNKADVDSECSCKMLLEENAALKSQIKDLMSKAQSLRMENSNAHVGLDVQNLQMELNLKTELWETKVKNLEKELRDVKDELHKKEMENRRMFTLEESLKGTEEDLRLKKNELSALEKKKHEEGERLLHRIKELQEALDEKTATCESLERYVYTVKTSLYNVFGNS